MEQLVELVNVVNGALQLDNGSDMRLGVIPQGKSIKIAQAQVAHPMIQTSIAHGWLVPPSHPAAVQLRAQAAGPVSFAGMGQGSDMPGMTTPTGSPVLAFPGNQGSDAVNLPGMVGRGASFDDSIQAPIQVADAASIITDGRSRPDKVNEVLPADQVIRNSMRQQNTIVPPYQEPQPVMPAGQVIATQRPGAPQQNVAVGQPGYPVQGQAGAYTRPIQEAPPFMGGQPVQPQASVQPPPAPMAPQAPVMPQIQSPYPQGFTQNQFMGQQVIRHRGAYPKTQQVFNPMGQPAQPSVAPGGQMGQLILPSSVPGGASIQDIDSMGDIARLDIETSTNALLRSIEQGNRSAMLLSNYKDWDPQKKVVFITSTNDLDILYKLFAREQSGQISLYIQNQIVRLGGRVPDLQAIQAAQAQAQTQAQPAAPANVVTQILMEYPDWDDQRKTTFISTIKDTDLLNRLKKREPSAAINALISGRIVTLEAQAQQVQEQGPLAGAVVDTELPQGPQVVASQAVTGANQSVAAPQQIAPPSPEQVQQTVQHIENHPPFVGSAQPVAPIQPPLQAAPQPQPQPQPQVPVVPQPAIQPQVVQPAQPSVPSHTVMPGEVIIPPALPAGGQG